MLSNYMYIVFTPYQLMTTLNIIINDPSEKQHLVVMVQKNLEPYKIMCEKIPNTKVLFFESLCLSYKFSSEFTVRMNLVKNILKIKHIAKKIKSFNINVQRLFVPSDDAVCRVIFHTLCKYNKCLKISLFDDGVGTYDLHTFKGVSKLGRIVYFLLLNNNFIKRIDSLYCYQPGLLSSSPKSLKIIQLACSEEINNLFKSLLGNNADIFLGKKIVFLDQGLSEETEIKECLNRIKKYFAKEEVVVKLHPRVVGNTIYDFVESRDGFPFEILSSIYDFSDSLFIAVSSGGCINSKLMFGEGCGKVIYLIKLSNSSDEATPAIHFFERVQTYYGEDVLFMPLSVNEFEEYLKKNVKIKGVRRKCNCK